MGRDILLVGVGGFAGSVARYLVSVLLAAWATSAFPFATFAVNLVGCFLIGLIAVFSDRGQLISPSMRPLLTAGFCGGFTTFSAFSIESVGLIQKGEYVYVSLYIALSVILGFLATVLGMAVARAI